MPLQKKKLSLEQKVIKEARRKKFMTVFINGKQKRVRKPDTIDGLTTEEFIKANADPMWLHQNEMWEYIECSEASETKDDADESLR